MSKYNTVEQNRQNFNNWRRRMTPEERKAFDQARYKKYKARYNANSKKWAQANPHKSQASVHQNIIRNKYPEAYKVTDIITKDLAEWLKEHRGDACPYCEAPAFHIDHIAPLSKGGSHAWANIELICKDCNIAKMVKTKEEYIAFIERVYNVLINKEMLK